MYLQKITKVLIFAVGAAMLTSCSYFKHDNKGANGAAVEDGTQTSGLGDQDGFNEANKMKAPFNQVYYFDFDKFDVHQDDVASINVQANYLIAHSSAKIRIEGNTDERGSREYNIALGWKRAKAVVAVLKQQGVPDSQITTVSYGKEKPAALGHDEDSYRLNRRVNLVYEAK